MNDNTTVHVRAPLSIRLITPPVLFFVLSSFKRKEAKVVFPLARSACLTQRSFYSMSTS
jgi:hypothetical protein